ncbi:hypothetical protein ACNKU7_00480 [Microbulbifer sp. SA54]|uniref:hypothetical protein n=1 Tax=Microbulbifer sp. SA54 TaxID=3401577 RepID=UPI003AAE5789
MKQHPARAINTRSYRLPPWLAVVLLGVFLAARGLVPPGFMPAAVAGGSLYELCHGDSRSALLLGLTGGAGYTDSPSHHSSSHHNPSHPVSHNLQPANATTTEAGTGSHQHDSATAKLFSDNHCSFSATAVAASHSGQWQPELVLAAAGRAPAARDFSPKITLYIRPPGRAPPEIS